MARFSLTRQCNLCGRIVNFERIPNFDALLEDDDTSASVTPSQQKYCSVCGGELYAVGDDREELNAEARELARSGHEVSVYQGLEGDCWALVGAAGERELPLFAAIATSCAEAASAARAYAGRVLNVATPSVDVSALEEQGVSAQWGVLENDPTRVALRLWRGERPVVPALFIGTPEECVTKAQKRLAQG